MKGIFIFRKDLRIYDNNGLNKLLELCDEVYCLFIYDDQQLNSKYISYNSLYYLSECVKQLNKQLDNKLTIMNGTIKQVLEYIIKSFNHKIDYIGYNNDFTVYSLERDVLINKLCFNNNIQTVSNDSDQTLIDMKYLLKEDKNIYISFSGFYNNHNKKIKKNYINTNDLTKIKKMNINSYSLDQTYINKKSKSLKHIPINRDDVIEIIYKYKETDDNLISDSSLLSTALNFGVVSIREAWKLSKNIRRNLVWRSYYLCIMRYNPISKQSLFVDMKYNRVKWPKINDKHWNKFINSQTGFLIIDAIYIELKNTGYINNRARLLLATFWIKYLLINPYDQKYGSIIGYSNLLVDCCTSQNNYNHEWVLGSLDLSGRRFSKKGTNPLTGRMIRIDNEMIKKYDKDCIYIKKWLPKLSNIPNKELINWDKKYDISIHPAPIFNWKEQYERYCSMFTNLQ